jgi:hypothetical protein
MRRVLLAAIVGLWCCNGPAFAQPARGPALLPERIKAIEEARNLFQDLRTEAGRLITFCQFRRMEVRASLISAGRINGDPRAARAQAAQLATNLGPGFEQVWLIGPRGQAPRGTIEGDSYWAARERLIRNCERPARSRNR